MSDRTFRLKQILLAIFPLGYACFSISTLGISPIPAGDEAFYAQVMETAARTGKFAHERVLGIIGMDQEYLLFGKIYIWLGSLMANSGLPNLWGFRFISFLGMLITSLFSFLWLRLIYNKETGLLTVGLLLLSTPLFTSSHTIRPESLDLALISIALYFAQRSFISGRKIAAFISGVTSGLVPAIHLGSAPLVLLVVMWWGMEYGYALSRERKFWAWTIGAALAIFWWLLSHVLIDTKLFWIQLNTIAMMSPSSLSLSMNPFAWFVEEMRAIWKPYGFSRFGMGYIALALLAAGVIRAVRSRDSRDRRLLGVLVSLFVLQSIVSHNKYGWYVVFYLFFLCPLLARIVTSAGWDSSRNNTLIKWGSVMVVGLYMLVGFSQICGRIILDAKSPSLQSIGEKISNELPAGVKVWASAPFYFTNSKCKWVDTWVLQILAASPSEQQRLGRNIEEASRGAGITYLVLQSDHDPELAGLNLHPSSIRNMQDPSATAEFIRHYTQLVRIIEGGRNGRYVIRRILNTDNRLPKA